MPEFLLELFSEEIPARMQERGAEDLARLVTEALAPLAPERLRPFHAPRRIALTATLGDAVPRGRVSERGPRVAAPQQALEGFLRKHRATPDEVRQEGEYWVLERTTPALAAEALVAATLPGLLRRFPWPKSMRWGGTSQFTWVRPLRRILCLLDGRVVPFDLAEGADDGHGLKSGRETEGHRFHAPGPVAVSSVADWHTTLRERRVLLDADERKRRIADGIARLAAERGFAVMEDAGLLDEVAGLVEWPVPLLGRIDDAYMDLPDEVRQVSMRVNQRYFALAGHQGCAAPFFAFAANIEASDGGAAIIAGNERVLRARFADARHFWDQDRKRPLAARVPALDRVTFHARLGSQGDRVRRLVRRAEEIAPLVSAPPALAVEAARLAKADLVTGMVGEFPELQGVMGGYYARHDGADPRVAAAVRDHYAPRGASDAVPAAPVGVAVALADRLDLLAGFFAIGEIPTGSGDPYALRRAALGVIRILRENGIRLRLLGPIGSALDDVYDTLARLGAAGPDGHQGAAAPGRPRAPQPDRNARSILAFLAERLRVQLRAEGARHDVLAAVFAAGAEDDVVRLLARTTAVAGLLGTEQGANLLAAYRRAANILRIEDRKDGPHDGAPDASLLHAPEERALSEALDRVEPLVAARLAEEDDAAAMAAMATLRAPLDGFFDKVTVNDPVPELRRNRLRLLQRARATMDRAADFSRIEG